MRTSYLAASHGHAKRPDPEVSRALIRACRRPGPTLPTPRRPRNGDQLHLIISTRRTDVLQAYWQRLIGAGVRALWMINGSPPVVLRQGVYQRRGRDGQLPPRPAVSDRRHHGQEWPLGVSFRLPLTRTKNRGTNNARHASQMRPVRPGLLNGLRSRRPVVTSRPGEPESDAGIPPLRAQMGRRSLASFSPSSEAELVVRTYWLVQVSNGPPGTWTRNLIARGYRS